MTVAPETRGPLIGGEQAPAASGATFDSLDPTTAKPFATLALGSAADVDAAVRAARGAQPGWAELDPHERGLVLGRIAALVEREADGLARLESRDVGKPLR